MKLATEQQLKLIAKIEKSLGIKFEGKTMLEAAGYIMRHFDTWKESESDE